MSFYNRGGIKNEKTEVVGRLIGADMNSTSDQPITINSSKYSIRRIIITNASVSLTTAVGGIYDAASKGGNKIVPATQVYSSLTAPGKQLSATLGSIVATDMGTAGTLYLSLTTPQGVAATADIYIIADDLS